MRTTGTCESFFNVNSKLCYTSLKNNCWEYEPSALLIWFIVRHPLFLCLWILYNAFFCTLCRSFYNKKSKVAPLPIPAQSEDELQNDSDNDDEEYIPSETEEKIIENETEEEIIDSEIEEEIIESDIDNEQVNGNQIPPRARDNAEVKWGKRKNRTFQMNQL